MTWHYKTSNSRAAIWIQTAQLQSAGFQQLFRKDMQETLVIAVITNSYEVHVACTKCYHVFINLLFITVVWKIDYPHFWDEETRIAAAQRSRSLYKVTQLGVPHSAYTDHSTAFHYYEGKQKYSCVNTDAWKSDNYS